MQKPLNCFDLYRSLAREQGIVVVKNASREHTLLQPETPNEQDQIRIAIPTAWDVQEAVYLQPIGSIRPRNRPWLVLTIEADFVNGHRVTHNGGQSIFLDCRNLPPRLADDVLIKTYQIVRQRVIRYCYIPGVTANPDTPQHWDLITHG